VQLPVPVGCGESFAVTVTLFAEPTICVFIEALLPLIAELLVVTLNVHGPGVVVACTVKATRPPTSVAIMLPLPPLAFDPTEIPVTLHTRALLTSRVTVMFVVLSLTTRFPFASVTST
jgi:hypothetical protein